MFAALWCSLRCCLAALARPAVRPTTELMLDLPSPAPEADTEDIELLSFSSVDTREAESGAENRRVRSLRAETARGAGHEIKSATKDCVV